VQILPATLERIVASDITGERIVTVLKALELALQRTPAPVAEIVLSYQDDTDQVTPDDLIPVITFALRPARCPE